MRRRHKTRILALSLVIASRFPIHMPIFLLHKSVFLNTYYYYYYYYYYIHNKFVHIFHNVALFVNIDLQIKRLTQLQTRLLPLYLPKSLY
jgi:hypothetical protein